MTSRKAKIKNVISWNVMTDKTPLDAFEGGYLAVLDMTVLRQIKKPRITARLFYV